MTRFSGESLAIVLALTSGCAYRFERQAQRAYSEGRYLDAAERLEQHEPDLHDLGPERQARYGLYRGLAHLRLGDPQQARRWLSFTYECERARPTLAPGERALLDSGWRELSR